MCTWITAREGSFLVISLLFVAVVQAQDQNITIFAGESTGEINCDLNLEKEPPFWILNDTAYDLFTIHHRLSSVAIVDSFIPLSLTNVTEYLDNTQFQCATFDERGILTGKSTVIIVYTNPDFNAIDVSISQNSLLFDYQQLNIQVYETTVGWTTEDICNNVFALQGFLLSTEPKFLPHSVFETNMTRDTIPSSNLTIEGDPIHYRLVAIGRDGLICSDKTLLDEFYRFDVSKYRETNVTAPNTTTCYNIPKTTCISIVVVVQNQGMDPVFCPIYNSSLGRHFFESCISSAHIDPLPFFSNGAVCLTDKTSNLNGTSVHFLCSTTPCTDCRVRTILSSYIVFIAGPPDRPIITYDGDSLCFNTFSYEEFPVKRFYVTLTDPTGVPSISRSYAASSNRFCISEPLYSVCLPFTVNVSASNLLGMSPQAQFSTTRSQSDCRCYQQREQIHVNVDKVTMNSALVNIYCEQQHTINMTYILIEDQQNGTTIATTMKFDCGESRNFTGLSPNTQYSLNRSYSDEIRCSVASFKTDVKLQHHTFSQKILLSVFLPSGLLGLCFICIFVCCCCYCCRCSSKTSYKSYSIN